MRRLISPCAMKERGESVEPGQRLNCSFFSSGGQKLAEPRVEKSLASKRLQAIDVRHAARKSYRWPPVSQILHMTITAVCSFSKRSHRDRPPTPPHPTPSNPPPPPPALPSVPCKDTCSCWAEATVYRDCRGQWGIVLTTACAARKGIGFNK